MPAPVTYRWLAVALAWMAVLPVGPTSAAEPGRVRALVVLDTSDPYLVPGVRRDQRSIERLLASHLPSDRYTLDVLQGPSLTRDKVLSYFSDLTVSASDVLFFYYSGHGVTRPGVGHTLELRRGRDPLSRDDVRKAMAAKGVGLCVILTDCCSDRLTNEQSERSRNLAPPPPPSEPSRLADRLFFRSRGVIDLTASDGDVAYADDARGGFFTTALCAVAARNADKPMAWGEFAAAVRSETVATHEQAIREGVAPKLRGGQRLQTPVAVIPLPGEPERAVIGVIGLSNPTDAAVELEYRWADAQPWSKLVLPAGSRKALAARVSVDSGNGNAPTLTVRIDGSEATLATRLWDREGSPRFSDGKQYRFVPKSAGASAAKSRVLAAEPPTTGGATDDPHVEVAQQQSAAQPEHPSPSGRANP